MRARASGVGTGRTTGGRARGWSRWALALALGLGLLGAWMGVELAGVSRAQDLVKPPGPESFAKEPKTPGELWDAVDYLVRTGQAPLAVPYLRSFQKANPDDAVFSEIADRYGMGTFLRLMDHDLTRPFAKPLVDRLNAARRKTAADPARLRQAIEGVVRGGAEQAVAVEALRQAGAAAVPAVLDALRDANRAGEARQRLAESMGQLTKEAAPALIAALEAPDRMLAAEVAEALGRLGDARAVPFLVMAATEPNAGAMGLSANRAVERLAGRPIGGLGRSPDQVLLETARRFYRNQVAFPSEQVAVWNWQGENVAPQAMTAADAATRLGLKFAREALERDPANTEAQILALSLVLDAATRQTSPSDLARDDPEGTFAQALAAGPQVLERILRDSMVDGHMNVGAVAALALAKVTDRSQVEALGQGHPLVRALTAPDRQVQLAAARGLTELNLERPYAGSHGVVPALARFIAAGSAPRAVVIDGNLSRGNQVASVLKELGYETEVAGTGPEGFERAAERADVELVAVDPTALRDPWRARDTLANLRADARTRGIPIVLTGGREVRDRERSMLEDYPGVAFVVTPIDPAATRGVLGRELERMGARPLTPEARGKLAAVALETLGNLARRGTGPYTRDLPQAVGAVSTRLRDPKLGELAADVLGELPSAEAQRALAGCVTDPALPVAVRRTASERLAGSIRKIGPQITPDQERMLLEALDLDTEDAGLRSGLAAVIGALKPGARQSGQRLRQLASPPAGVVPPAGGPGSPSEPGPQPAPGSESEPSPGP